MSNNLVERASALLTPAIATAQLQNLKASLYPPINKSQTAQVWILAVTFLALTLLYLAMFGITLYRIRRGRQKFWLFRRLHRHSGAYVNPNGSQIFIFCAIFCYGLKTIAYAMQLYAFRYQHFPLVAGNAAMYLTPMIFIIAGYLAVIAQTYVVCLTLEDTFSRRMPTPWLMNLLCYGFLFSWVCANVPIIALMIQTTKNSYNAAFQVRQYLYAGIDGK